MSSSRDVGYENNNIRGEINQINNNNNRYKKLIKLTAVIAGKPALILVDCGSSGNFVSKAFFGTDDEIVVETGYRCVHIYKQV